MEFTYQSTMQLPASYAVLSEDEMVYTVGGAFELNINCLLYTSPSPRDS